MPRGRLLGFGAARVAEAGVEALHENALLLEFPSSDSLEEAVNSGFTAFDSQDDTVATVLAPAKPAALHLPAQPAKLDLVLRVTRKATGKVETVKLTGTVTYPNQEAK